MLCAPAFAGSAITLSSTAFAHGQPIPDEYTCEGADISPPLKWLGVPAEAKSLAIVCDDPDAPSGTWTHWILYGLPADVKSLPAGVRPVAKPPTGGRQAKNSFGRIGYGGPCPPAGRAHRYFFRIYALDGNISVPATVSLQELDRAMQGHILASGKLMGIYRRK